MNTIENPSLEFERQYIQAVNARRKLKGNKPKFILTSDQVVASNDSSSEDQVILTVKSIQTFLLSCSDKSPRAYSASWCKVLRVQKLQQILVIVLNGMTDEYYQSWRQTEDYDSWKYLFTSDDICHQFRFHTLRNHSFIQQFSKIAAKTKSANSMKDPSMLKIRAEKLSQTNSSMTNDENPSKRRKVLMEDKFSRIDLVLNLKQLIAGNYPCPEYNSFNSFKQIKSFYKPISSFSRIFALDVETFEDKNQNRQIPYWLSIVDENLDCIYQTLIKCEDKTNGENYEQRRTKVMNLIPDISERTLAEVHQDLGQLFDDDLILAGHSIENDLKYLQMYYPYIIDTSIIFNITGSRLEKSSLQKLYAVFFGRLIQKTRLEHDPTEDARATMELIQLKLSQNIEFGDWFLGGVDQMKILGNFDSLKLNENIEQCQTFLAQTKFGFQEDFFKKVKHQQNALLIEQKLDQQEQILPTIEVHSNRRALKTSLEQISNHEFLWIQLYVSSSNDENEFTKINKYLRKLYEGLREDSILFGIIAGQEDFARCFIRIKDEEKFLPLIIDGIEYPYNLKLLKSS